MKLRTPKFKYVVISTRDPKDAEETFRQRLSLTNYSPPTDSIGATRVDKIWNAAQQMKHWFTSKSAATRFANRSKKAPNVAAVEVLFQP